MSRKACPVVLQVLIAGLTALAVGAQEPTPPWPAFPAAQTARAAAQALAAVQVTPSSVTWAPVVDYESLTLTLSGPEGVWLRQEFSPGDHPSFGLFDTHGGRYPDGSYTYELRAVPPGPPRVREEIETQRRAGNSVRVAELQRELPAERLVLSGTVTIRDGSFVNPAAAGSERPQAALPGSGNGLRSITAADHQSEVVHGKACIGGECAQSDLANTLALMLKNEEINLVFDDVPAQDTASRDWIIQINDVSAGTGEYFRVRDDDAQTSPFTITGGAPDHSLFVSSSGNLGLGTSTPGAKLHLHASATADAFGSAGPDPVNGPAFNFGYGGATFGRGAGFLNARPDASATAPNPSLRFLTADVERMIITSTGKVGLGTSSPTQELTLKSKAANENVFEVQRSQADNQVIMRVFETSAGDGLLSLFNNAAGEGTRLSASGGHNWFSGTLGINCNADAGFDFSIKSGFTSTTACNTGTCSQIDAGSSTFTTCSSRAIKENLRPVRVPDILEKVAAVEVYAYDFIDGAKDKLGLVAEDFHTIFGRGSDKLLNGQEVEMALWLAVKELTARNEALARRNEELDRRLAEIEARLALGNGE